MLHHIENHIENMRQKPDHKKKQYAFAVSLCFTLVVFGFWVAGRSTGNESIAVQPIAPVKALTASVGDAYEYVMTFFVSGNKTNYEDPIEVVPGKI